MKSKQLYIEKDAVISKCEKFRYSLSRIWDKKKGIVLFICLNPSTADATKDDPTIRRCIGYAKSWGYGGFYMANLFAFRATNPHKMKEAPDCIGPENDQHLSDLSANANLIICGWGEHGKFKNRALYVVKMILKTGIHYLKLNKSGEPAHPLYLRKDLKPQQLK